MTEPSCHCTTRRRRLKIKMAFKSVFKVAVIAAIAGLVSVALWCASRKTPFVTYSASHSTNTSSAVPDHHTIEFQGDRILNKLDSKVVFSNRGDAKYGLENLDILSFIFRAAFANLTNYEDDTVYNIDVDASIQLGVERDVIADRPAACEEQKAVEALPKASIVIPYYKEHWSVLLRTLYSLYKTTDWDLIEDIVLVDDKNDNKANRLLQDFLKHLPKVTLLRTLKNEGLIRARLIGARAAWGDVLVIVDAHMVFTENWLPPLLREIAKNKSTIVIPTIDTIEPSKMMYTPWSGDDYGSFDWELDYLWLRMPEEKARLYQSGQPVETATILGCAMAVSREYFFAMGAYDDGLNIWGGESLELSFRTWMCGGRVLISPCSRVGHLFRSHLPYIFEQATIYKNLQRVAEVWFDDYKHWYFDTTGQSIKFSSAENESIRLRKHLRKRLQCHDFSWYLSNVATSVVEPLPQTTFSGYMRNLGYQQCLSVENDLLKLEKCLSNPAKETFGFTKDRLLRHRSGQCLTMVSTNSTHVAKLAACDSSKPELRWSYSPVFPDKFKSQLQGTQVRKPVGQYRWDSLNFQLCLDFVLLMKDSQLAVTVSKCDFDRVSQYWIFAHRIYKKKNVHD